jgi:hypothetical protein
VSDKPTIPEVLPLVRAIYHTEGGNLGCCFYSIFENPNYEREHAEQCLDRARADGHLLCIALGELLIRMSKTQRKKLASMNHYPKIMP